MDAGTLASLREQLKLTSTTPIDGGQGRVFRAIREGSPMLLKLYGGLDGFTAEVESLRILHDNGAPVPRLMGTAISNEGSLATLIEWWEARDLLKAGVPDGSQASNLLRQAGRALGRVHGAAAEGELAGATLWMRHGFAKWDQIAWRSLLQRRLDGWLDGVRLSASEKKAGAERWLAVIAKSTSVVPEPDRLALVHCDFSCRNVLVAADRKVLGVIDFEHASVGDPVYDLAKLLWTDLSEGSEELAKAFLKGWEEISRTPVSRVLLDTYIGVQATAALAWVDRRGTEVGPNQSFRELAIKALNAAHQRLDVG